MHVSSQRTTVCNSSSPSSLSLIAGNVLTPFDEPDDISVTEAGSQSQSRRICLYDFFSSNQCFMLTAT